MGLPFQVHDRSGAIQDSAAWAVCHITPQLVDAPVRLWLRQLSQDRLFATVQLVATSLRPLNDIFKSDESPDYSPLHNVMSDIIKLGPFTLDEARHFITKSLEDTPFSLEDFSDILKKSLIPRNLRNNCRERYDELTTDRGDEHSSPL
jgi:hypothetical protein